MERHFTVTGFVIDGDRTLLHWHRKLQIWLPPGGHIDPDEDPVQAVLREVVEETGIVAEIVADRPAFAFANVTQLPPPFSMIVADVGEGESVHQHIDFAYIVRPVAGAGRVDPEHGHGFIWVNEEQMEENEPLLTSVPGRRVAMPEDVREVGLAAFAVVRTLGSLAGRRPNG